MTTDILITAEQFETYRAAGVPARKIGTESKARYEVQLLQGAPVRITEYVPCAVVPSCAAALPALPEMPEMPVADKEVAIEERISAALANDSILQYIDDMRDRRIHEIADRVRASGENPFQKKVFHWVTPDTRPLTPESKGGAQ